MAELTPEQIIDLVAPFEVATQGRRNRMDSDRKLLRLEEYNINTQADEMPAGANYRSFTANEPMAFQRKVSSVIADAKLLIQIPYGLAQEQERFRYDLGERFYYGILEAVNERLRRQIELELQDQLAGIVPIRGWGVVWALMRNRADGTSFADIQVWDARNCYWDVDEDGLKWICYKSSRTAREVMGDYPNVKLDNHDDDDVIDVYNFTDRTHNTVVVDGHRLKAPLEHGWNRVPASLAPVGPLPRIWDESDIEGEDNDTDTDYGESIFAPNRRLFDMLNEVMSILLELASKQLNQTYVHRTNEEGSELEESPNTSDAVITIAQDANLDPLNPVQSTRDLLVFLESVMGMIQRGALPHVSYGQLAINISGFAVTQLNKQFVTVLGPLSKAVESLMKDALVMLADQFVSGRFNPMTIRGMGNNRDYMQVTFSPEMMANLPPPVVQLVADLPEDDVSRMSMAQQAKQGQILPDRYIWEKVLKLPDTAQIQRQMDEQIARLGSPLAQTYSLFKSTSIEGNQQLAQIYQRDMQVQQIMQQIQVMQAVMAVQGLGMPMPGGLGAPGGGGGGQQQLPGPPGFSPEVLPFIMENGEPSPAPRNAGPNQMPGTPRPGAQDNPLRRSFRSPARV